MLISNLRSYILITHYKKVESNDELKEVKNCTCYYFDDTIKT